MGDHRPEFLALGAVRAPNYGLVHLQLRWPRSGQPTIRPAQSWNLFKIAQENQCGCSKVSRIGQRKPSSFSMID
jgi:hypothetical protein